MGQRETCLKCETAEATRPGGYCYKCFRIVHPNFRMPQVSAYLRDLRVVYGGKVDLEKAAEPIKNLTKLWRETPKAFLELKNEEEERYRDGIERAWAAAAKEDEAQRVKEESSNDEPSPEADLPAQPVEELIQELLGKMREL